MAQYRSIHTKITQSFDFNEMPDDFTRLTWTLLPLGLDCEGRGIYNTSWIRSKLFPLREDITTEQITAALEWYRSREMIEVYEFEGRSYFCVPTFKQYQRGLDKEAKSVLPAPEELQSNSRVTPDLLQSNSSLKAKANANAKANAEAEESAAVSPIQRMIESVIGLPPSNADDLKAIEEIGAMDPLKEDIQSAANWILSNGRRIVHYSSLVNPVKVSIAKRVQRPGSKLDRSRAAIMAELEECENVNA